MRKGKAKPVGFPPTLSFKSMLDFHTCRALRRQRHVCNFVTCITIMTLTCDARA
ncbi:hypothetical protein HanIR_Chr16g0792141 [Helianthus annuus]|nr:hypothetical protein HanIR_Chr16g0792141 [Helianthus annuus]